NMIYEEMMRKRENNKRIVYLIVKKNYGSDIDQRRPHFALNAYFGVQPESTTKMSFTL
ncbi:hypothetical protein ACJX0J_040497, partial [Zea mays]